MFKSALLALEDGNTFPCQSIGNHKEIAGEVVFNTSITGYQEILSDPSYAKQIIVFTHPHIGNTGTNAEDDECSKIFASATVIRDLPLKSSSWRKNEDLEKYFKNKKITAVCNIDTRNLTRNIRKKGSLGGYIAIGKNIDKKIAIAKAKKFGSLKNLDLAKEVTTKKSYVFNQGSLELATNKFNPLRKKYKVVVYDYGVKKNILRMLVDRGCELIVVPAKTKAKEVLNLKPNGILLSNGPGDPMPCDYAIDAIKVLLESNIPIFGICLGHQLLSIASGAKTKKLKFGHHGANHPVKDLKTNKVVITSQNHNFCVAEENIPKNVEITHRSLFDNTIQGIKIKNKSAFSFQGHPEASPGPHDVDYLFDYFIRIML